MPDQRPASGEQGAVVGFEERGGLWTPPRAKANSHGEALRLA